MMKKTLFFCLGLFIFTSQVIAQNSNSGSIKLNNTTLKEFFKEVENKCGYSFMYSNVDIDDTKTVTVNGTCDNIKAVLDQAFKNKNILYEITPDNKVILKKSPENLSGKGTPKSITGTVLDNYGDPVIGASVMIKGTTIGATTDIDGNFKIDASDNDVLDIRYLGFQPQEVKVGVRTKLDIKLMESDISLDEVVVIGYGTLKKKDLTGAINTVNTKDITSKSTSSPIEALQGVVSGVVVQKTSGMAGGDLNVKIRGVNTFGNNNPLYIIDGFPGDINSVNPNDIASMDILKDGAAAAIYGSVAANGVVIVTTKGGQKGKVIVDLNSYVSVREVANTLDMLDSKGYVNVHKVMYENYNQDNPDNQIALPLYITDYLADPSWAADTNWMDETGRTGVSLNQSVAIRGGTDDIKFALSGNLTDDKGIFIKNNFLKQNARTKINAKKGIFSIEGNMSYTATKLSKPNFSLRESYMISPLVPVYDENQPYGYGLTDISKGMPANRNPIADINFRDTQTKKQLFTGSFAVGVDITKDLNFRTSYSYTGYNSQYTYHYPDFVSNPKETDDYPYYEETRTTWNEQVFDNVLSYNKLFGSHSLNLMAGTSMTKEDSNWGSPYVEGKATENGVTSPAGFFDPNYATLDAGLGGTFGATGSKYRYNRMSYFGRVNYSYGTRYLLQFTLRRDGSSKFSKENRWGTFPSLALGWRINEEAFFPQVDAISNLKLRASWGKLGNEAALGTYEHLSLISSGNSNGLGSVQGPSGSPWPGMISKELGDKGLKWETTESINIGLDYGFLNNNLFGAVNFFSNTTKDLLITKKMPLSAGVNDPILNVGKIRNSGLEFELTYVKNRGDFQYSVGMNTAFLQNKVLKLADEGQKLLGSGLLYGTSHFPNTTVEGKPIGAFFLYETDGIFQSENDVMAHKNKDGELLQPNAKPGDIKFRDTNGDGTIDDDDKTYQGSGMPKFEANLNLSASYKGFDFSALIGSGWGHKLYNGNRALFEGMYSGSNFLASSLNAWSPSNTSTDVPRAVLGDPNQNARESTRFLEDGDFIRLRQIQIGYTLPKHINKMLKVDNLRFYISGENLLTWTKYDGLDPEFSSGNDKSGILSTGVDSYVFPFTRSYVFGLQVSF